MIVSLVKVSQMLSQSSTTCPTDTAGLSFLQLNCHGELSAGDRTVEGRRQDRHLQNESEPRVQPALLSTRGDSGNIMQSLAGECDSLSGPAGR